MKKLLLVTLAFLSLFSCKTAKLDLQKVTGLERTFYLKNKYLISGDKDSLALLLHPSIAFCHSNCWMEDLQSVLTADDIKQLDYKEINVSAIHFGVADNTGIVRGTASFVIKYKNQDLNLKLCFVETYIYRHKKWLLLARQSSKLPD